ncbi:hypothetical protein XELAEV_18001997mg [Xenopus laevis]|nr:hypothetical protein XELAEV_18001997mg [Xenopus laevis]
MSGPILILSPALLTTQAHDIVGLKYNDIHYGTVALGSDTKECRRVERMFLGLHLYKAQFGIGESSSCSTDTLSQDGPPSLVSHVTLFFTFVIYFSILSLLYSTFHLTSLNLPPPIHSSVFNPFSLFVYPFFPYITFQRNLYFFYKTCILVKPLPCFCDLI